MNPQISSHSSTWNTRTDGADDRLQRLATLGLFAAGIAHEFNNLMTPTAAAAQIALASSDPDAARIALHRTLDAVRRSQNMIEAILRAAAGARRSGAGSSLRDAAEAAVSISRLDLAKSRIRVALDIPPSAAVQMDDATLLHVFLNLVVNASRAMAGGGFLKLKASPGTLSGHQAAWIVDVSDTGRGMPTEQAASALDPLGSRSITAEGTGIGLPLCRELIRAANGEISINSSLGTGTIVRVTLPSSSEAKTRSAA